MKKVLSILLVALLCFTLISCNMDTPANGDKDASSASRRIEQVAKAVTAKDKEMLKGLFSIYITEDSQIDGHIDDFLEYINGTVISYEIDETPVTYDYSDGEGQRKELTYWGTLRTDEETYSLFFVDYPIDSIDEENEGLHTLRIIKTEKVDLLEGSTDDWAVPGVYIWDL